MEPTRRRGRSASNLVTSSHENSILSRIPVTSLNEPPVLDFSRETLIYTAHHHGHTIWIAGTSEGIVDAFA